ncbi:hypothetical protein BDK51DRAFT_47959 [Blyttiomyces helicus]|uniref:Uncharacterized protein n=1 Tax=Blyttiomyces helicus TaxID=388810 RepID=A0A4P9VZB0_9FUNG|nr:hypothetical protein BDK51DRAFT_47959 [Blyttiomyces helicus]|eukprot:RKO85104.1 hypothetical protein BDK51DRAFT_47959 [Blyttiomyces helicus]
MLPTSPPRQPLFRNSLEAAAFHQDLQDLPPPEQIAKLLEVLEQKDAELERLKAQLAASRFDAAFAATASASPAPAPATPSTPATPATPTPRFGEYPQQQRQLVHALAAKIRILKADVATARAETAAAVEARETLRELLDAKQLRLRAVESLGRRQPGRGCEVGTQTERVDREEGDIFERLEGVAERLRRSGVEVEWVDPARGAEAAVSAVIAGVDALGERAVAVRADLRKSLGALRRVRGELQAAPGDVAVNPAGRKERDEGSRPVDAEQGEDAEGGDLNLKWHALLTKINERTSLRR